jgi:NADH-quinone oxidoreductase subunit A
VTLWPLGAFLVAVLVVVGGMVGVSWALGERRRERATGEVYESGVLPTGSAHARFSIHFYLVAMIFLVFDLEAVYLLAWAVAARDVGWTGYVEILVFVAVLIAAWAYLLRVGALDWGPRRRAGAAAERRT